jgi:hypothetical protein
MGLVMRLLFMAMDGEFSMEKDYYLLLSAIGLPGMPDILFIHWSDVCEVVPNITGNILEPRNEKDTTKSSIHLQDCIWFSR